jgi:DNA mismatch repair protein MutS
VLRALLEKQKAPAEFSKPLKDCADIVDFVIRAITDRPPSDFERGNIIRAGFSAELDELRDVLSGGKDFLARFETREKERSGIRSLKVGYNKSSVITSRSPKPICALRRAITFANRR